MTCTRLHISNHGWCHIPLHDRAATGASSIKIMNLQFLDQQFLWSLEFYGGDDVFLESLFPPLYTSINSCFFLHEIFHKSPPSRSHSFRVEWDRCMSDQTKGTVSWSHLRLVIYRLLEAAPENEAVEAHAEGVGLVKMTSLSLSW